MPARKHLPLPAQRLLLRDISYCPLTGNLVQKYNGKPLGKLTVFGYLVFHYNGKSYRAHRIIWMMVTGEDPGEDEIDHKNGKKNENWWDNLRRANRSEQGINSAISTRNTSGVKGVWYIKTRRKYAAKISVYKVGFFLGEYDTLEEAAAVRLSAELAIHGEFRRTEVHKIADDMGIELPPPETILAKQNPWPRLKPPENLLMLVEKVKKSQ